MIIRILCYEDKNKCIDFIRQTIKGDSNAGYLSEYISFYSIHDADDILEIEKLAEKNGVSYNIIEDPDDNYPFDHLKGKKEEIHKLIDESKYEEAILAIVRYIQLSSVPRG